MTLRLILMRHAKSSWDSPVLEDYDRPLNGRGKVSAKALGDWLRSRKILPEQALVSSAARTRETFAGLNILCDTAFLETLYHAGPGQMMKTLQRATAQTVLMIGHNPGIAWFARELVATPPNHPRFADYPTCATLVAEFEAPDWASVKPHTGLPLEFVIPRELTG